MAIEVPTEPRGGPPPVRDGWLSRPGARHALIAFGLLNVGIGIVGIFVPLLPTTIFLIIALWAFSRSSQRFHDWLFSHPRLGPPLQEWHAHGVIAPRAKLLAVGVMALSFAVVVATGSGGWWLPALMGAILAPIALFIVTRPGRVPD